MTSTDIELRIRNDCIRNIYDLCLNEANVNNLQYALDSLIGFRYIPNSFLIPNGRYVRYIDTKNHLDMKLRLGGFVTSDNSFSVSYISCASSHVVKVNKKHCIFFIKVTQDELLRCSLINL